MPTVTESLSLHEVSHALHERETATHIGAAGRLFVLAVADRRQGAYQSTPDLTREIGVATVIKLNSLREKCRAGWPTYRVHPRRSHLATYSAAVPPEATA